MYGGAGFGAVSTSCLFRYRLESTTLLETHRQDLLLAVIIVDAAFDVEYYPEHVSLVWHARIGDVVSSPPIQRYDIFRNRGVVCDRVAVGRREEDTQPIDKKGKSNPTESDGFESIELKERHT